MNILMIFIMNIILVSYVRSDPPSIMCGYTGADGENAVYKGIKVTDVPSCCTDVLYGGYYFNDIPSAQESTDIATIKKKSKPVWVMYMCEDPKALSTAVCSQDPSALDNYLSEMVKFAKDNTIDGIILAKLKLQNGTIPGYTNVVGTLVSKIKECVPGIKVGLELDSSASDKFADKNTFDFNAINDNVDLYAIDLSSVAESCTPKQNANGGKLPTNVLDKVWKDISSSNIDKTKLVAFALDYTVNSNQMKLYSEYCARKGSDLWCADSITNVYNQVTAMKKNCKGIVIIYMDFDDFNNTCGCGPFPIANAMFDAWEGKSMTSCAKLC